MINLQAAVDAAEAAAIAAAVEAKDARIAELEAALADCEAAETPGDTTAPTVPTGLVATVISSTQITLTWTASTDGVTGYKIFRGGVEVGTRVGTSFADSGLTAGTAYSYTVKAHDAAGNLSASSAAVSATTSAAAPPPTGTFEWKGLQTVWPTAATTGPRIARVAATSNTVSGLVKGKKFTGTVFAAAGTVFEDCEFIGTGGWGIDADGKKITVDHCLMKGGDGPAAILGNCTVLYSDISGWQDAIKTQGSGWVIRGNYIHGPFKTSTSHNDGIQIQWSNSNGIVEQNRIEWTDTSEVFCQKLTGTIDNIIVRHNWMGGSDHPLRIEAGCTNCKATENVIKKGTWGYWDLNSTVVHSGNIDAVTGASID